MCVLYVVIFVFNCLVVVLLLFFCLFLCLHMECAPVLEIATNTNLLREKSLSCYSMKVVAFTEMILVVSH